MTLYERLGVAPDVTPEELEAVWRARQEAVLPEEQNAAEAAYALLRDPARRAAYDRQLAAQADSGGSPPSPGAGEPAPSVVTPQGKTRDKLWLHRILVYGGSIVITIASFIGLKDSFDQMSYIYGCTQLMFSKALYYNIGQLPLGWLINTASRCACAVAGICAFIWRKEHSRRCLHAMLLWLCTPVVQRALLLLMDVCWKFSPSETEWQLMVCHLLILIPLLVYYYRRRALFH